MADKELAAMEHLKARSRYLRGNLAEDMADPHHRRRRARTARSS